MRQLGAVHRRSELLRGRGLRIVGSEVRVIRLVAVCAPESLELAGVRVDDCHALVAVAVCHVDLVRLWIDEYLRGPLEALVVVAPRACSGASDLHQELAGGGELEDVRVGVTLRVISPAVAADPHVVLVIDGDAMVGIRPHVALGGTAPMSDKIAGRIELEDRRRRHAALVGGLRIRGRTHLGAGIQGRATTMNDPHVIA